ncbi:MAG: hypothetical protein WA919_13985 [Coleofasciculaceae cyanobacterium]
MDIPQETSSSLASGQIIVALLAGLIMAFAFQILLANLGIAAGITALGYRPSTNTKEVPSSANLSSAIGLLAGLGILLTINTVVFAACFLASRLVGVSDSTVGATLGIFIWSTYFLILIWASSTAVSSVVGSIFNTATSGFRGIISAISTALSDEQTKQPTPVTEEKTVETIRQELRKTLNTADIKTSIQDYLESIEIPKLDSTAVQADLTNLLKDSQWQSLASSDLSNQLNRQSFVDLISDRTDLSKDDSEQLVSQLEASWQEVIKQNPEKKLEAELLKFIKEANTEELKFEQLTSKLEQLTASKPQPGSFRATSQSSLLPSTSNIDFKQLTRTLLTKVDLSDWDIERIWGQLQSFESQLTGQSSTQQFSSQPFSMIKVDVEDYVLNAYPWQFNSQKFKQEFIEVLYDQQAAPEEIQRQLEQLNRDDFVKWLTEREELSSTQVEKVANQLEDVRLEVLATVKTAFSQEQFQELKSRLKAQLYSLDQANLKVDELQQSFQQLLNELQLTPQESETHLRNFEPGTFSELLKEHSGLGEEEKEQLSHQLTQVCDRLLEERKNYPEVIQSSLEELWQKLEAYLLYTSLDKLDSTGIERKLQTLLEESSLKLNELQSELPQLHTATLEELLTRRKNLEEEQIKQLIEEMETTWQNLLSKSDSQTRSQEETISKTVGQYLQKVDWSELDPEGVKQDLVKLLDEPQGGMQALRRRISQLNWASVVEEFKQEQNLSEIQINQMLDGVRGVINQLRKNPRRWASRAKVQAKDLQNDLQDYLLLSEKQEFNPQSIKRDLQLLLNNTPSTWEDRDSSTQEKLRDRPLEGYPLRNRFSDLNQINLKETLSQRQDITELEANKITEQIESIGDQLLEQARSTQQQLQSLLENLLSTLRNYINSLKLPELDYEQIKNDLQKFWDSPQSQLSTLGNSLSSVLSQLPQSVWQDSTLTELRQQLSQITDNTINTLVESRQDISETVSTQLRELVEGAHDTMLQQADELEQAVQKQVEELKKQAEATRKAAAIAAWLLFSTALTSCISAAIAGALSVRW